MMGRFQAVLASRNRGKIREFHRLFRELTGDEVTLLSLDEVGLFGEIEENGTTFEENALIKARAAAKSGYIGIGDDSGLAVTALHMAPGVHSARYAGEHGNDAANNALLLQNMEGKEDRSAAFVTALALVFPKEDGREPIVVHGKVEGVILREEKGEGGFGYDPLFYYPPFGKTFAELTEEEKNRVSHRGMAVKALLQQLKTLRETGGRKS